MNIRCFFGQHADKMVLALHGNVPVERTFLQTSEREEVDLTFHQCNRCFRYRAAVKFADASTRNVDAGFLARTMLGKPEYKDDKVLVEVAKQY